MDTYSKIRKMHREGYSERDISKTLGIHRNTVHKYMDGKVLPGERKRSVREVAVMTAEVTNFITGCLKQDEEEGIKKQQHTARRIYDRLVAETGFNGGESTVRKFVHEYKKKSKEAFVPLVFPMGDAVQVDWGEIVGYIKNDRVTLNIFCARLCASEAPFVIAYRRQNFESFQDAIIRMFEFFGGVPKRMIFDNARIAVREGFGAHATATDKYALLAAHYSFEPVFCNISSGIEKGLVEELVGFFRRNICVPIPRVESLEELNEGFLKACKDYESHRVFGRTSTVGELLAEEKKALFALPERRYDPAHRVQLNVSKYSLVNFETNRYSVPVEYVGKSVTLKALPETVEIWSENKVIASHKRCYDREKSIFDLAHYLPLLEKKGRAIFQARPFVENAPEPFVSWLEKKKKENNLNPGNLVDLIRKGMEIGFEAVMQGYTATVIQQPEQSQIRDVVTVAPPNLSEYDSLLGKEVST